MLSIELRLHRQGHGCDNGRGTINSIGSRVGGSQTPDASSTGVPARTTTNSAGVVISSNTPPLTKSIGASGSSFALNGGNGGGSGSGGARRAEVVSIHEKARSFEHALMRFKAGICEGDFEIAADIPNLKFLLHSVLYSAEFIATAYIKRALTV